MMASAQQEEQRASGMNEVRVGFINASPLVQVCQGGGKKEMKQLGAAKDEEAIRETLRKSGFRIRFRSVVATPSRVCELLNDGCQIIHYVGHGDEDYLSFEPDNDRDCGIMEPLKVNALKNLFKSKHVRTKLVFVSSCCSESSGKAFVDAGVPHVVAVKAGESVADEVAHLFGRLFYGALLGSQRYGVQEAFDRASVVVSIEANARNSEGQGGPFVLLPRGGNHDVPILDQVPRGDFIEETLPLPEVRPCLPRPRQPHMGIPALQKLLKPLLCPSVACVTVVGKRGSGKTQRAIQLCKYVRERRKFDAMFFVRCDKIMESADVSPSRGWEPTQDPCWLIGRAVGMNPPPSSVQQLADHLFSRNEGGPRTVLLVLDGIDALVEERDRDARGRFFDFANSLCSRQDSYTLKLLVTSSFRVNHDGCTCFESGREQVETIAPLEGTDPAELFHNAVSRLLTRVEVGIDPGFSPEEFLEALLGRLEEARGHPGTLVTLASTIHDVDLRSASFVEKAASLWESFQSASRQHPLPNDGGTRGTNPHGPGARGHNYARWPQEHDPRWSPDYHQHDQQQQPQQQPQVPYEPESLEVHRDQQHAQGTSSLTDLKDPGCHFVWVKAIANAKEDSRSYGSGDRPTAGGAIWGRADLAPLEYLCDGLRGLLYHQQTTSGDHNHVGDYGLYECLAHGTVDFGDWSTYEALNAPMQRSVSVEEISCIKERLLREQERVVCGGMGTRASGPRQDDNRAHAISIEAFVRFSEWWAPVMATLSRLRSYWLSTDLVRVHWFVGAREAFEMLSNKTEGTFLLRFSESSAGALAIVFTERISSTSARAPRRLRAKKCLVEVDERGNCYTLDRGQRLHHYTSLRDLIWESECLRTLYPDFPKKEAFQ